MTQWNRADVRGGWIDARRGPRPAWWQAATRCDKCGRDVWPTASRGGWTDTRSDADILGAREVCPAYAPDVNRFMVHTVDGLRIPPGEA